MNRRTIALIAGGAVAGALLVGAPVLAFANPVTGVAASNTPSPIAGPGATPDWKQMAAQMSRMMSDPGVKKQMQTMMKELMPSTGSGDSMMGENGTGSGSGDSMMGKNGTGSGSGSGSGMG